MKLFLDKNWVVLVLLSLVVLAVFGRTIWFDYIQLDEGILLVNNRFFLSDLSNVFEAFKHDINYPGNITPYYRPVFILSFIFNSQFGSNPLVFHIGNILLHIVAVSFVFWFFLELGFKRKIALVSSALFAVHPSVSSVVAWVPGRLEAILTIFALLSFIMFMRFLKTADWRYLFGFFVSFTIALLTKEAVLGIIPVLLFYYLTHRKEKGSEMLTVLSSGLGAIIVVWFFVRKNILAGANINDVTLLQMLSALWSNSAAVILYLGKTILPFNMSVFPVLNDSTLFYGFAALIILAAYWFSSRIKFSGLSVLGFLWFLGFLVPSLIGFYPTEKMVFFEHRLYLPLVGVLMFFAGLKGQCLFKVSGTFFATKKVPDTFSCVTFLVAFVLFSVFAFNYSSFYRDRLTFWEKAAADSPTSSQGQKGLAMAYLANGRIDEANAKFVRTLELNPQEKGVHLLLGLYYLEQKQYDKGIEELEKEIEIDPTQYIAHYSLGRVYAQKSNYKEAEKYFLKTVEINPDFVLARQDLTVLYFSRNKHSQAVVQLKELLRIQRPEAMHPQILKILEIYAKETVFQKGF